MAQVTPQLTDADRAEALRLLNNGLEQAQRAVESEDDDKDKGEKEGEDKDGKEMKGDKDKNPFAKDSERSMTFTGDELEALVSGAVERGVQAATAALAPQLETMQRSIASAETSAAQSLTLADASLPVLSSMVKQLELLGKRPSGRQSLALEETQRSAAPAEVAPVALSLAKLVEVCRGMDVHEVVTIKQQLEQGNAAGLKKLSPEQRGKLGL